MNPLQLWVLLFCSFSANIFAQLDKQPPISDSHQNLELGEIKAVFVNNEPFGEHHRGGYNGIAKLTHKAAASNLFVPFYAGFNLEHIFAGDSLINLMEPRKFPMQLNRISKNKIELYQSETPISHVESWTTFELKEPHYIDIEFRCIIKSSDFFKHDYAGLFWASYIHEPEDKKIYFIGRKKDKEEMEWINAFSNKHGFESTHLGIDDLNNLFMAPNFNATLASNYSNYLFTKPFYYGRSGKMVFAYLFSNPEDAHIRFSQSPTGGGSKNPAWDFQFIIPNFQVGKTYSFKTRLIYKEWINRDDILNEFNLWKK